MFNGLGFRDQRMWNRPVTSSLAKTYGDTSDGLKQYTCHHYQNGFWIAVKELKPSYGNGYNVY